MPKCPFDVSLECEYSYRDAEFQRQLELARLKIGRAMIFPLHISSKCCVEKKNCQRWVTANNVKQK